MQPVVELIGGEKAVFLEQFADGGKVGGGEFGDGQDRGDGAGAVCGVTAEGRYFASFC